MKRLKSGTQVRRKKPHFDSIYSKSYLNISIEEYYSQIGTVTSGGGHIVRVKWPDDREYKYGTSVLERLNNCWKLDDKLFEI